MQSDESAGPTETDRRETAVRLVLALFVLVPSAAVISGQRAVTDFIQDYAAARAWWDGANTNDATRSLLANDYPELARRWSSANPDLRTAHPPFVTLLTLPFGLLPFSTAQLLWVVLCWLAIVSAWQVLRVPPSTCAVTALLWIEALQMGTHEPLVFLLLGIAICVLRTSQAGAGCLLGLATAAKVYPGVLILGLLVGRKYRATSAALASAAGLALLAELVIGVGSTWEWARYMPENTRFFLGYSGNVSLVRPLSSLWPGIDPTAASVALLIVFSLPLVPALRRGHWARPLLPVVLLCSPLSWRRYVPLVSLDRLKLREELCLLAPQLVVILARLWPEYSTSPALSGAFRFAAQAPFVVALLLIWFRWSRGKHAVFPATMRDSAPP